MTAAIGGSALLLSIAIVLTTIAVVDAFYYHPMPALRSTRWCHVVPQQRVLQQRLARRSRLGLAYSSYDNGNNQDDEDEDEKDDGDDEIRIDADSLGDWRTFRRNLVVSAATTATRDAHSSSSTQQHQAAPIPAFVYKENEELLWSQNEVLAQEYSTGVWSHTVATPEIGGLVVRMPLEVEIYRNHRYSIMGRKLQKWLQQQQQQKPPRPSSSQQSSPKHGRSKHNKNNGWDISSSSPRAFSSSPSSSPSWTNWYYKAQQLVEEEMKTIAATTQDGQIDASLLSEESADMLQLYLDNQETWQEVCFVLDRDESAGTATTLVLNRPMALKLTENLGRLVLFGAFSTPPSTSLAPTSSMMTGSASSGSSNSHLLFKFLLAFGQECAVYVGGPDAQDRPANMLHGHSDLAGAHQVAPGVYQGGSLDAVVDGVLHGRYRAMDFRFFVGRHEYTDRLLDVAVVLGKFQPMACARSLVLKQCISLPKPLWHEVLDLCGSDMKDISSLEMLKRDDLQFSIIDDEEDEEDDEGSEYVNSDELDELKRSDDEDDDYNSDEHFR